MMKVAVFLAKGFEEIEAVTVVDVLRRGELHVVTVSVTDSRQVVGSHGIPVVADHLFDEVDFDALDLLVLPGGMPGTTHLQQHAGLMKVLKEFSEQGKYIGAICAAPSILGELGLLDGHDATCYPGFEPKLRGAHVTGQAVVKSGRIVTGKGAGVSMEFALALVRIYESEEYVKNLRQKLILR